jgi:Xaa-Pro aminopeptidase
MMRDLMKRDRLDALIFTTADFFQFATNFHVDVQPWERPILACVTLEGEPQAIMNELSTHHMMMAKERGHVWVKDVQFYSEHPKVAERQFLLPQLPEMIAEFLRKLGLSSSRIGVDGSFSALARAAATLPELKLIPSLEGIRTLRWVKHAEELEVMRRRRCLISSRSAIAKTFVLAGSFKNSIIRWLFAWWRRVPADFREPIWRSCGAGH